MSDKDQEKKKVVFKLNVSKHKELPRKKHEPQLITEWNYTRLAISLVILVCFIAVAVSISLNEDVPVVAENDTQGKQLKEVITNINHLPNEATDAIVIKEKKHAVISSLPKNEQTSIESPDEISGNLVRAQLAKGIWKNEPFGEITGTIKVNSKEATGIFYFTELENMKGQAVFHIWKYKGDVIFKKKKDVTENHWQTYTSKLFTRSSVGPWSVETVDSNDRQLNLINFTVVSATD